MNTLGKLTYPEIGAQADSIASAMMEVRKKVEWVQNYVGNNKFDQIVFIGSGSSYYQAISMAAAYRKWLGRCATALPSSDFFLMREQSVVEMSNNLLICVSRSGESSEVLLALESVKDKEQWEVCGITCYEESSLAKMCNCLVSTLGKENSVVMTKSFSSMTYMMQCAIALAAMETSNQSEHLKEIESVIQLSQQNISTADMVCKELVEKKDYRNHIFLGLGSLNGIVQEACLKLKEMSNVWTESFGTLEFRHGPKAIIDEGSFVCVLLSENSREYELKVAKEMKEYGAFVLLVTAEGGKDTAFADIVFELGGKELSDEARTVMYLPFVQYFGFYTALKNGVNPDNPRNLSQVVII